MKKLLLPALLLVTQLATAQKAEVLKIFAKYKIDESVLNMEMKQNTYSCAFDLKQTSTAKGKTKVQIASYDPTKTTGQRFTLLTVDGKAPSNSDIKDFNKEYNKPLAVPKMDDNSIKIVKQDANTLIISYKYVPSSLTDDISFLNDCTSLMFFDLATGMLQKAELTSEKSFKVKMINVIALHSTFTYAYNAIKKKYYAASERSEMTGKFLGQSFPTTIAVEFSNLKQ